MKLVLLVSFVASSLAFTSPRIDGWVPSYQRTKRQPTTRKRILPPHSYSRDLDHGDSAKPLPLSATDLARFTEMKTRATTMPIVLLDTLVPGQKLYFQSPDPKFDQMIQHVLQTCEGKEIGIIGFHPGTKNPLNMGVTATVSKNDITYGLNRNSERVLATSFKGNRRFEVVGEPWMDDTQSFYIANVEIVDNRYEVMTAELERQAMVIHETVPKLVQEWVRVVIETDQTTPAELNKRLKEIGTMPTSVRDRAIWVSALVNPIPPLGVCLEIRPAMLACRNDHDRMVLASTALQSSIDHMSGKQKNVLGSRVGKHACLL